MNRPNKWKEVVQTSKENIEDFNDFSSDKAIVWADKELQNYKKAMLILVQGNPNWDMHVTEDQYNFINTMTRRGEV